MREKTKLTKRYCGNVFYYATKFWSGCYMNCDLFFLSFLGKHFEKAQDVWRVPQQGVHFRWELSLTVVLHHIDCCWPDDLSVDPEQSLWISGSVSPWLMPWRLCSLGTARRLWCRESLVMSSSSSWRYTPLCKHYSIQTSWCRTFGSVRNIV